MHTYLKCLLVFLLLFSNTALNKENNPIQLSQQEVKNVIQIVVKLLNKYYVSANTAKTITQVLLGNQKSGQYNKISSPYEFAHRLTLDIRSINNDQHLNINYRPQKSKSSVSNVFENKLLDKKGLWTNYGYQEIKHLDGNIGYVKISHFSNWGNFTNAKESIDSLFNMLRNSKALILDVRDNSGGYEDIVAYFISYLIAGESIKLSDYYVRFDDSKKSIWTTEKPTNTKLPNIPVYVLTNGNTASAGESLAYILKHLKRSEVVGEVTAGAGHGAMTYKINDKFSITISSEETINAVTKTSFEGVGVIPTFAIESEKAFQKAYDLALHQLKKSDSIHSENYDQLINLNKIISSSTIDLKPYVGKYKSDSIEIHVKLKSSQLYATMIGKGTFKLLPTDNHIFVVDPIKERIQFVWNKKNKVIKLIGLETPMELNKYE